MICVVLQSVLLMCFPKWKCECGQLSVHQSKMYTCLPSPSSSSVVSVYLIYLPFYASFSVIHPLGMSFNEG